MIQLGRYVRDLVTGFIGVATGRSEWLYGCARVSVDGVDLKDGKPIEPHWYDEQRIEYADDGPPAFSPVHPLDSGFAIKLGSKCRDRMTGFSGIASAQAVWASGEITVTIDSEDLKDGKPVGSHGFPSQRVELVEVRLPPVSRVHEARSGGPQNDPKPTQA